MLRKRLQESLLREQKEQDYLKSLLIYPKLDEIQRAVHQSSITIVKADTGSGKTIGIPYHLMRGGSNKSVYCAVPSAASAVSSVEHLKEICKEENSIGHGHDNTINYNKNTKLVYCTPEHLLNRLLKTTYYAVNTDICDYNPWFCSIIILDEFHIRNKEMDQCLCLWIYCYSFWEKNMNLPKPPKLIIVNSTVSNDLIDVLPINPTIVEYVNNMYSIETIFDEDSTKYPLVSKDRYNRAAELAIEYHQKDYPGIYLIFVPGKCEADIILKNIKKKLDTTVDIYPAYSGLNLIDLIKIEKTCNTRRKIIIGTKIMQHAINVKNVSLVIDTMTQNEVSSGLDESMCIKMQWIPKTVSVQRMGRTGRTCNGIYHVLQSEEFYENLPEDTVPEIDRISISYDILKIVKNYLDPVSVLAPFLPKWKVDVNMELLKKLGFINPSGIVTEMGDFCSKMPLNIRKAAMVYHLVKNNCPEIFLHMAVICTLQSFGTGVIAWPIRKIGEDRQLHSMRCDKHISFIKERFGGYSDVDVLFNIWIDICKKINPFFFTDLRLYCQENGLIFKKLKDSANLLKQCIFIGNKMEEPFNIYHTKEKFQVPDKDNLSRTFFDLLILTHQDYETRLHYNQKRNVLAYCGGLSHRIDRRSCHSMPTLNNPKKIYYSLVRTQKRTKTGALRIVNILHSLPHDDEDDTHSFLSSDVESDTEGLFSDHYRRRSILDSSMDDPFYSDAEDD